MYLSQSIIDSAKKQPSVILSELDRQQQRVRSLDALKLIVVNEIQQGDPALCSAFADFCATSLDSDTTVALCLSRIHRDNSLQGEALKWLRQHVDKCQELFVAVEVERRIATALVQELPQ
ncbi:hypothetical protein SAMN05216588_101232 [Pseudomonas flavescens]|uniref:Uncharacterized protein n=1 Tax=Phytopseudomonas flavescens TaxID=29435 RepID=A0A1G7XQJ6_9GAMM|nr:hypothetical protein [Pseudomonas flavescens]SDG86495.1 hypothetical protein SAMN05216588_101232 [Pseudomonas flavescens]